MATSGNLLAPYTYYCIAISFVFIQSSVLNCYFVLSRGEHTNKLICSGFLPFLYCNLKWRILKFGALLSPRYRLGWTILMFLRFLDYCFFTLDIVYDLHGIKSTLLRSFWRMVLHTVCFFSQPTVNCSLCCFCNMAFYGMLEKYLCSHENVV
jgi:hypothetical protein